MYENIIAIIVILICVVAVGRRLYRRITKKVQNCECSCDCGCSTCSASLSMDQKEE